MPTNQPQGPRELISITDFSRLVESLARQKMFQFRNSRVPPRTDSQLNAMTPMGIGIHQAAVNTNMRPIAPGPVQTTLFGNANYMNDLELNYWRRLAASDLSSVFDVYSGAGPRPSSKSKSPTDIYTIIKGLR